MFPKGIIFRRIGHKIIPMRAKLMAKLLPEAINKVISSTFSNPNKVFKGLPKKDILGRGIDFDVVGPFKMNHQYFGGEGDVVVKLAAEKTSRGWKALSRQLLEKYKGIEDPALRGKTLAASLPNYGVATVHTDLIRVRDRKYALLQPFKPRSLAQVGDSIKLPVGERMKRDIGFLESKLDFDAHLNNITTQGELRDAALGKLPTLKAMRQDVNKELFSDLSYYAKRPDFVSDLAIQSAPHKRSLRKINALMKKGYRFRSPIGGNYQLKSPMQRAQTVFDKKIMKLNKEKFK